MKMSTRKKKVEGEEVLENVTFSKEQILSSKRYRDKKDLVNVLLKNEKSYSLDQVDDLIDKFMKGKVK